MKYPINYFSVNREREINIPVWTYEDERSINLNIESELFLKNAPEFQIIQGALFSHFLFPDLTGSLILNKKTLNLFFQIHFLFMEINECDISFIGHLHVEHPIIITSNNVKRQLHVNDIFYLETGIKYIILCPALFNSKSQCACVSYDQERKSVEFLLFGTQNPNPKYS